MTQAATVSKIDGSEFDNEVLESKIPVLVDFYTDWCGPCKNLAPILDQVAGEAGDRAKVVKVNAEEDEQIAVRYNIRSFPTVVVFRGGEEASRIVGLKPKSHYLSIIEGVKSTEVGEEVDGTGDATLFDALLSNDEKAFHTVLKKSSGTLNDKNEDGLTALNIAILVSNKVAAEALLEAGATADHLDLAGLDKTDELRTLLDENPDLVTTHSPSGVSPVGVSAMLGAKNATALLIERGVDVNVDCGPGSISTLSLAMRSGDFDTIKILLEAGADPNSDPRFPPLHSAAGLTTIEICDLLLAHGADPHARGGEDSDTIVETARNFNKNDIADHLEKLLAKS